MDAFFEETDKKKRMPSFDKVGIIAVVGNEDGAHHCHAEIYQALNDVGFTIPACAGTYCRQPNYWRPMPRILPPASKPNPIPMCNA